MNPSLDNLAGVLARVERLEKRNEDLARQNGWLRWAFVLFVLVAGGLVIWGRSQPTVLAADSSEGHSVQGRKLMLQDEHGKTRAGLEVGKDGPALLFYDAEGNPRGGLSLGPGGTALRFLGANGRATAGLSVERGGIALGYVDETGRVHAGNDATKNVVGLALTDHPAPAVRGRP
jgi:hypothetical protein